MYAIPMRRNKNEGLDAKKKESNQQLHTHAYRHDTPKQPGSNVICPTNIYKERQKANKEGPFILIDLDRQRPIPPPIDIMPRPSGNRVVPAHHHGQ